jgi:quinol monooxygenase YgiN
VRQIIILASHKIDDRFTEEFRTRLNFHVHNCIRIEPGCLHFSVAHDSTTGLWHYVEIYSNQDAFDAHSKSEHFQKHIRSVKHMILGGVNVTTAEIKELASK